MKVVDVMERDIITIDEDMTVAEASKLMREKNEGYAIVLRRCNPVGIVTERDVTWKVAGNGLDSKSLKVSEIMSSPLITVDPDEDLVQAAKQIEENKTRGLAVSRKGILYGILTVAGVVRHFESHVETEIRAIFRYTLFPPF